MAVRTYSGADLEAARAAWDAGEFSDEWTPFRELAASRGILYPPSGSKWDSWEDSLPSQRAILVRAIRDTPQLLGACIGSSRSWSEVVSRLLEAVGEWREQVARGEAQEARRRHAEDPTRVAAIDAVGNIFRRLDPR